MQGESKCTLVVRNGDCTVRYVELPAITWFCGPAPRLLGRSHAHGAKQERPRLPDGRICYVCIETSRLQPAASALSDATSWEWPAFPASGEDHDRNQGREFPPNVNLEKAECRSERSSKRL